MHELFEPHSAQAILSLPIPIKPKKDKLIWVPNSRGIFSVKSAYQISRINDTQSKVLWKIKASKRIETLL